MSKLVIAYKAMIEDAIKEIKQPVPAAYARYILDSVVNSTKLADWIDAQQEIEQVIERANRD